MIIGNLNPVHKRLSGFILASVLAHVAIVQSENNNVIHFSSRLAASPDISAKLVTPQPAKYNKGNGSRHLNRTEKPVTGKPIPDKQDRPDNGDSAATSTAKPRAAAVYARIRGQLQHHFHYPQLAKRYGWQGRVLLDFTVSNLGRLNNIRIRQSSGYDILDHAAVDALSRVVIADAGKELLRAAAKHGRMSLPVVYRLIN